MRYSQCSSWCCCQNSSGDRWTLFYYFYFFIFFDNTQFYVDNSRWYFIIISKEIKDNRRDGFEQALAQILRLIFEKGRRNSPQTLGYFLGRNHVFRRTRLNTLQSTDRNKHYSDCDFCCPENRFEASRIRSTELVLFLSALRVD